MKRGALFFSVGLVLAAADPAAAVEREVTMPGKFFLPGHLVVLVGDTVRWQNDDVASHDVVANDGSFDSGRLLPGASFSYTFARQGAFPLHCSIHKYMRGEIDVYALALVGPERTLPRGATAVLNGLAPRGVSRVSLLRQAADGSFAEVDTASVAADGSFRFQVRALEPATYKVAAGTLESATVTVSVGATLTLVAHRQGHGWRLSLQADPAQPHARFELQVYSREKFTWQPFAHGRLDGGSAATLAVRPKHALHLRAVLPNGVSGFGRAVSRVVVTHP